MYVLSLLVLSCWGISHLRHFTWKSINEGCHVHYILSGLRKYCASNRSVVPYKASAAEHFSSFFTVMWSPRSISSSCSNHLVLVCSARSEAFRLQCSLSSMPFAWKWYPVVWVFLVPKGCDNLWNSSDSNWRPRSVVTLSGTPYLAVVYVIISGIGNASHHLENLSTHVNRYNCPSHQRSGQVMSMWECSNLSSGAGNLPTGACACRPTLAFWHFKLVFVHALMSALIRGQTNLSVNRCVSSRVWQVMHRGKNVLGKRCRYVRT